MAESPPICSERLLYYENVSARRDLRLTSQFRRAAVSVPANIAEVLKKKGRPDKARFMNMAQGSLEECRYYLILTKDLKYGETPRLFDQLDEVSRLLASYTAAITTPVF